MHKNSKNKICIFFFKYFMKRVINFLLSYFFIYIHKNVHKRLEFKDDKIIHQIFK